MGLEQPGVPIEERNMVPNPAGNQENAGAGNVPNIDVNAAEVDQVAANGLLDPVPLIWLCVILLAYAYHKNMSITSIQAYLAAKFFSRFSRNSTANSAASANFQQQAGEETNSSREDYLSRMQAKIDATAAERKEKLLAENKEKEQNRLLDKINKNEAILKGTHYSGPGRDLKADEEEDQKRKEIEAILKKKREQRERERQNGTSSSNSRSLRDDFNPLGDSSGSARYRPTQPTRRSA